MTLAAAAVLLLIAGAVLTAVGLALRQAAAWECGLGGVVGAVVLFAAAGGSQQRWWAVLVAPALVVAIEAVRLAADAWWRGGRRLVEPAVVRAGAAGAAVAAAVTAMAGLAVAATVPRGTVPGGLLAVGLAVPVVLLALLAGSLRRLGPAAAAARRHGPGRRSPLDHRRAVAARRRPAPTVRLVLVLAGLVGGAVLLAAGSEAQVDLTAGPSTAQDGGPSGGGAPGATSVTDPPPPPDADDRGGGVVGGSGWWMALLAVVLGLVVVALFSTREQIVPPEDSVPDPLEHGPAEPVLRPPSEVLTIDRSEVLAAVDDALVRLRDDADPRVAVRVAYATVAEGLGRADLARRPSETEGEYLRRVLVTMGGGGTGLQRLTDLFAVARFSEERVDEPMRAEALALLEELRGAVARNGAGAATGGR